MPRRDRLEIRETTAELGGEEVPVDIINDYHRGWALFCHADALASVAGREPFAELCHQAFSGVEYLQRRASRRDRERSFVVFVGEYRRHLAGRTHVLFVSDVGGRVAEHLWRSMEQQDVDCEGEYAYLTDLDVVPVMRYRGGDVIAYVDAALSGHPGWDLPEECALRDNVEVRYALILPRDAHRPTLFQAVRAATCLDSEASDGEAQFDPTCLEGVRPPAIGVNVALPETAPPQTALPRETYGFLYRFFVDHEGEALHIPDRRGDLALAVKFAPEDTALLLRSDWRIEWQAEQTGGLTVNLVIDDQPDDPLHVPFGFVLDDAWHAHSAVRFAIQPTIPLFVLTARGGCLVLVECRHLELPTTFRAEWGRALHKALEGAAFELRPLLDAELMVDRADTDALRRVRVSPNDSAPTDASATDTNGGGPMDGAPSQARPQSLDIAALLAALTDRDTRAQAAVSLCATGDARYIGPVTAMLEKITWAEADAVASALPAFGPAAVPSLMKVARKGRKAAAACAMAALAAIGGPEAAQALEERLVNLPTKNQAAECLVEMGGEGLSVFVGLLTHSQADVRRMAVYGIGKLGAVEHQAAIEAIADNDRSGAVREMAETALRWLRGEEECMEDLRRSLPIVEL